MSVPLDRLYHFINGIVNRDTVIYRWFPHGSKNLEHLIPLDNLPRWKQQEWPWMICHDQEPLDQHRYSRQDWEDFLVESQHVNQVTCLPELWFQLINTPVNGTSLVDMFEQDNLKAMTIHSQYDKTILLHSELRSRDVTYYQSLGFVPAYYWNHALLAKDWFRYAEVDPNLKHNSPTQTFLIYNRAWSGTREYRLKFVELLLDAGITDQCCMRFNEWDSGEHYTNHEFKNPELQINRFDFQDYLSANNADSSASADYDPIDYQQTSIEVVLETVFDDTKWHLTEKTLRPIACGHPFLLVATPGSLEYLRTYGFKTFDSVINEDYDSISDPVQRLEAIVDVMKNITADDVVAMREIALYNQRHFFSETFQNSVIGELKYNLTQAYNDVIAGPTHQSLQRVQEFVQGLCDVREDFAEILKQLYMQHPDGVFSGLESVGAEE